MTDFQVFELLHIVEQFAVEFDDLPRLIPSRPEYRLLIAAGVLVAAYSVIGQLTPDGEVELVQLDLDLGPTWEIAGWSWTLGDTLCR
jgi:hypothetical protein